MLTVYKRKGISNQNHDISIKQVLWRALTSDDESLFLSLSLSAALKKSTAGKFAYTCHFQQIGINATKIEKTGIHFKTDVFAAVAVVDAKTSYFPLERPKKRVSCLFHPDFSDTFGKC